MDQYQQIVNFFKTKRKVFILEDNLQRIAWFKTRFPKQDLTIVSSVAEAKNLLDKTYDIIFLDHDLTEEHNQAFDSFENKESYLSWLKGLDRTGPETGYDFALYLEDNGYTSIPVIIHSMNIYGSTLIRHVLTNSIKAPFEELKQKV